MCLSAHCLGGNVIDQNSDQALVLVGMDSWLGFDALVPIRTDDMRPQLISLFFISHLVSSIQNQHNTLHCFNSFHFPLSCVLGFFHVCHFGISCQFLVEW